MLLAPCALAVLACAPGAAPPSSDNGAPVATASADTLRGTVEVVGSEPATSVTLADGRGRSVTLEGERRVLLALQALEVMVEGRMEEPGRFRVERVAVRSANGVPAVDGVIAREGGRLVLATGDGRRLPVPHLPAQLAGKVGARVWLAGPLDRHPDTFGIITKAP